jgi:hypothetical protein
LFGCKNSKMLSEFYMLFSVLGIILAFVVLGVVIWILEGRKVCLAWIWIIYGCLEEKVYREGHPVPQYKQRECRDAVHFAG